MLISKSKVDRKPLRPPIAVRDPYSMSTSAFEGSIGSLREVADRCEEYSEGFVPQGKFDDIDLVVGDVQSLVRPERALNYGGGRFTICGVGGVEWGLVPGRSS